MLRELADRAAIVDLNGNHVTAVHGDEAEHTCYYQAQHVRRGLADGDKFLGGGRYDDRLRRISDGWLFTHRKIISVWSDGNPAVIAPCPQAAAFDDI